MPVAKRTLPPADQLRSWFRYAAETGELFYLPRTAAMFEGSARNPEVMARSWNTRFVGRAATIENSGYIAVHMGGQRYLAHRVIWKLVHGSEPDIIDHINGNRRDNRLANLRNVTEAQNKRNLAPHRTNRSGRTGVRFHKLMGRWQARYCRTHLGTFDSFNDALAAREAAEVMAGYTYRPTAEL